MCKRGPDGSLDEFCHVALRQFHCYRVVDVLIAADETYYFSSPAAFEAIDACQGVMFIICRGDAPKVVLCCALLFGPAYGLPLQQVVGHKVTVLVAGRAIEVGTLPGEQGYEDAREHLPIILG